jgi:hypothetical protein
MTALASEARSQFQHQLLELLAAGPPDEQAASPAMVAPTMTGAMSLVFRFMTSP